MTASPKIKAYYINCDKDVDRRRSTDKVLSQLGLDFERLAGTMYSDLSEKSLAKFPDNMVKQAKVTPMIQAELSLSYNHRRAWKKALAEDCDYVMVFEDDIITYISEQRLKKLILEVHRKLKFDILYLGKCLDTCAQYEHQFGQVYRVFGPHCAHAYMLTRSTMKYLIKEPLSHSVIDRHIRNKIQADKLAAYAFHPSIFIQDVLRFDSNLRSKLSSLQNMTECQDLQLAQEASNRTIVIVLVVIIVILIVLILLYWYQQRRR
uniref:Glycosyltransferase family 25 n=1 Tax=Pithovirus LCPAC103 TaxID=2506588 RepID=A0A481Z5F2_9VIRU|nr:MAG: glycosyltransferase family 25 [Pithovirus LCPAC103]